MLVFAALAGWLAIVVISMAVCTYLALRWGRDPFGWVLFSAAIGPFAVIGLIGTRHRDVEHPAPTETLRGAHRDTDGTRQLILVPVDGSPAGEAIAKHIVETDPESRVTLLVVLPHESAARPGQPRDELDARADDMTRATEAILEEAGIPVEVSIAHGVPGEEIVRCATELRPADVMVGRRGMGVSKALLGSVSDYVVKHSPVPVTVIG
jgi:nucleotide-binding universal stress UspA family protein